MHPLSAWNRNYRKTDGRPKMSEDDFAVEPIEGCQNFSQRRSNIMARSTKLVAFNY